MRVSRRVQALIPLVLTPFVLVGINSMGSDKAVILVIPWVAFSIVYLPFFLILSKRFTSSALLAIVSSFASLVTAYAITFAVLSFLSWRAST